MRYYINHIKFVCGILWLIALTYASLKAPSLKPPVFFLAFPHSDKLVHFCMYFGMAFWLFFCMSNVRLRLRSLYTFGICVAYGILMEILQELMAIGRSMDIWDAIANTAGATVFLLIILWLNKRSAVLSWQLIRS